MQISRSIHAAANGIILFFLWLSSIPLYSYLLSIYLSNVRDFFFKALNETMPSAAPWMDLEISILNRVRQTKATIIYHLYVESKKIIQMNLCTKQKQTHRRKNNLTVTKGDGGRGIN